MFKTHFSIRFKDPEKRKDSEGHVVEWDINRWCDLPFVFPVGMSVSIGGDNLPASVVSLDPTDGTIWVQLNPSMALYQSTAQFLATAAAREGWEVE